MNAGTLKAERLEPFRRILALIEENKRKNQYHNGSSFRIK